MLVPIHSISNTTNTYNTFLKRTVFLKQHIPLAITQDQWLSNRATWQAHLEIRTNRRRMLLASCVWRKTMLNIHQCTVRFPEDNQVGQNERNWSLLLSTYYYPQSDSANRHLKIMFFNTQALTITTMQVFCHTSKTKRPGRCQDSSVGKGTCKQA